MDTSRPELLVIENHDQLYDLWSRRQSRGLHVCHVDFHCDMRGLLVDRARQLAYKIPDIRRGVDMGNFLTHAIVEGGIEGVRWVHDRPGGRSCDVHTVKYTEDLTSLPYNIAIRLNRLPAISLKYAVVEMDAWSGPEEGDFLDIDWDVFADREIPRGELDQRVEVFFAKQLDVPLAGVSVCYSPSHSHDTRTEFERFVKRLEELYDVSRVVFGETGRPSNRPWFRRVIPPRIYDPLRAVYYDGRLWLRRHGIY